MSGQVDFSQNIRGKVVDMSSGYGLTNANIIVLNSEPPIGASADVNGLFLLENVPVGRQSLQVSYAGYQTVVLLDLYVSTGKERMRRMQHC